MTFSPLPEIASTLRVPGSRVALSESDLAEGGAGSTLTAVKGSSLELHLNCSGSASSGVAGLRILGTADGKSFTTIGYDYGTKRLVVDHSMSAQNKAPPPPPPPMPPCSVPRKPCPGHAGCSWCPALNNKHQCSEYCPAAAGGKILQTAPLAGGLESDDGALELILLVDRGLVESFLNRRAVISSFVSEIMGETTPAPADRTVAVAPSPSGVTCKFEGFALQEIN